MNRITLFIVVSLSALTLPACGGGGGSGSSSSATTTSPAESRSFTISLDSVEITRRSNGDNVAVDTTGVSSDNLNYNPN